jgi:hypothetical protein
VKPRNSALITPVGIASYAFVWKAQPSMNPGQDPKFSITLIVPKKADLSELKDAVNKAGEKKFGSNYLKLLKNGKINLPFRDGDEEREGDPLYEGKVFFSAKSTTKPGIVDAERNPIEDEFDFYSGCKCRLSVYPFGFDVNGNKGVAFALNNVQKVGDGERLSGRRSPEEDFDDIDVEEVPKDKDRQRKPVDMFD